MVVADADETSPTTRWQRSEPLGIIGLFDFENLGGAGLADVGYGVRLSQWLDVVLMYS